MINYTLGKHQLSQKTKIKSREKCCPSKFSINLIMGYATAVRVLNTENIGQINIILN